MSKIKHSCSFYQSCVITHVLTLIHITSFVMKIYTIIFSMSILNMYSATKFDISNSSRVLKIKTWDTACNKHFVQTKRMRSYDNILTLIHITSFVLKNYTNHFFNVDTEHVQRNQIWHLEQFTSSENQNLRQHTTNILNKPRELGVTTIILIE